MKKTNNYNHLIDTHKDYIKEDTEEKLPFEDRYENTITEAELEDIHPDLDKNFPSPKMNSGLMNVHHTYPEKFIDEPEDF